MNLISGSLLACLITLGLKHNPLWKKIIHVLVCLATFVFSYQLIWIGQVYPSLSVTVAYVIVMISWTLYVRYPLYITYARMFDVLSSPELSSFSQLKSHLVLKPFTPKWREEFLAERSRVGNLLRSKWKDILEAELSPDGLVHIGSTAITDIGLAKPQHDCALAVTCHRLPKEFRLDLAKLGYQYIGVAPHSLDCSDHFFVFVPNDEDKDRLGEGFFLHVVTPPVHEWLRTSQAFCAYLSDNAQARETYANLKKEISRGEKDMGKSNIARLSSHRQRSFSSYLHDEEVSIGDQTAARSKTLGGNEKQSSLTKLFRSARIKEKEFRSNVREDEQRHCSEIFVHFAIQLRPFQIDCCS